MCWMGELGSREIMSENNHHLKMVRSEKKKHLASVCFYVKNYVTQLGYPGDFK